MRKLFTEHFVTKLDGSFSIKEKQRLNTRDYLSSELCCKIGKKIGQTIYNFDFSNFNVYDDIILYVSSIHYIDTDLCCYYNVAVCLK